MPFSNANVLAQARQVMEEAQARKGPRISKEEEEARRRLLALPDGELLVSLSDTAIATEESVRINVPDDPSRITVYSNGEVSFLSKAKVTRTILPLGFAPSKAYRTLAEILFAKPKDNEAQDIKKEVEEFLLRMRDVGPIVESF